MSQAASGAGPRFLEWDTRFFGVRIGTLAAHGLSEERWRAALEWCRKERIECLYLLSDQHDREQHVRAEAAGARRVDERTSIAAALPAAPPLAPDPELRLAVEPDLPALRALAGSAHTNSRFWRDGGFARERCAELYSIWIERDVRGQSTVYVAGPAGAPLGYVTVALEPAAATMGLLAVAENARGQGLGRRLTLRAFEFARAAGRKRVELVTQGPDNVALKLYASCGFQVERIEIWHHLWLRNKA